jgi:hypothetical protein
MAFVNLPPNFQDMFYSITDRIAKLETGPNQAMYTAESAQGSSAQALALAAVAQTTASNAQVQAVNAGVQANNAASQATIAQSQATIASSQATAAQVTANGKNKVYYSTSGPGATANTVGDIWYQYGTSGVYLNKVIAQYSGAGGTSWTSVTVSGLIIANIDAGSITTGTLSAITITAGSGANSFNVSSSGVMSAQGVWVKGNITADTGTFNGSLYSKVGYFGESPNYWELGSSGLTGVGNATITAGYITGSTITGGIVQTSTGANAVVMDGPSNALGIKYGGTYAGWLLGIGAGQFMMHYGNSPSVTGYPRVAVSSTTSSLAADGSNSLSITTSGNNMQGNMTFGGSTNTFSNALAANGTITYPGVATGAGTTMVVVTTGSRVAIVTSSERFKEQVQYVNTDGWLNKVLAMKPITYKTSVDFITEGEPNELQYGFLAEDIYDLGGGLEKAVILDPLGDPFSLSYDRLTVFLTLAMKEINARLNTLEGK